MVFSGNQSLYWWFGVQELRHIKNLTPSRASPVRKRVWAWFVECKTMCEGVFIDYRAPCFIELAKYKNDEDCQYSGVLQHPAFSVGQMKRSWSYLFCHYERSNPFWLQFSRCLHMWALQQH
jgi:hypothetical protein